MGEQLTPDIDWAEAAKDHYGEFDHPLEPSLKVKDFGIAVDLATATKFGGDAPENAHASPHEAGLFWKEFSSVDPPLAPQQYREALDRMAPLSWRYHQRAPTLNEVSTLRDADPAKIRGHYESLPATHWGYPDITAGDYVKAHTRAEYWSQQHLSRAPYSHEVALFHHSGMSHDAIGQHYSGIAQDQAQRPAPEQPDPRLEPQRADPVSAGNNPVLDGNNP